MADTDSMTVPQFEAFVSTVDNVDELEDMRRAELDGQNRKGVFEAIDRQLVALGKGPVTYDTYDLNVEEQTTYCIAHPTAGEVKFTTDEEGFFTPSNEQELWAVQQLGAEPRKEIDDDAEVEA